MKVKWSINGFFVIFSFICFVADDGKLLEKLPKVRVLRNDKREGEA